MQAVRVVSPVGTRPVEARRRRGWNADKCGRGRPACRGIVGERPVDRLGHAAGHGDRHHAARLQDPGQLSHGGDVVRDVLEHLGRDDPVERPVGKGQASASPCTAVGRVIRRQLAGLDHGAERRPDLGDLVGAGIERDDEAPRRAASNAWRPNPQPRSSTRSPGPTPSRS